MAISFKATGDFSYIRLIMFHAFMFFISEATIRQVDSARSIKPLDKLNFLGAGNHTALSSGFEMSILLKI